MSIQPSNANIRRPRVCGYLMVGLGAGAAMIGAGVLLAATPGPWMTVPAVPSVFLASFGSPLPQAPATAWWLETTPAGRGPHWR